MRMTFANSFDFDLPSNTRRERAVRRGYFRPDGEAMGVRL